MTVALFIEKESDVENLIPWGVRFASTDHAQLLIVIPGRSKGKQSWESLQRNDHSDHRLAQAVFSQIAACDPEQVVLKEDIGSGAESSDHDRIAIEVRELLAPNPAEAFIEKVVETKVQLLVMPAYQPVRARHEEAGWQQQLFSAAPCRTMLVSGQPPAGEDDRAVLIASDDENDPDVEGAIQRGVQLARASEQTATLLFVRPDDDLVARQIAQKHVDRMSRFVPGNGVAIEKKVQLAEHLVAGILQQDLTRYSTVMVGVRKLKTLSRLYRESETFAQTQTAVVISRQAVPWGVQFWGRVQEVVRQYVPQIDRERRISLVDRLQTSSKFDFDFLALISLSTLIAALGLLRNSAAVVIGAMLVAPLMTPLVAIGFSLVQGNEKLIRSAVKSVLFGFAVAFVIGWLTGMLVHLAAPSLIATSQMQARSTPNLLDLIVALASGIAGAYAMGRPHLVSALPGVAIAAALVPPIATSGLALALTNMTLCGGSLLLFFTNIIAIALGTAITFWAVGIDHRNASHAGEPSQLRWPRYGFLALVILSFVLAAQMSLFNQLEPGSQSQQSSETQTAPTTGSASAGSE